VLPLTDTLVFQTRKDVVHTTIKYKKFLKNLLLTRYDSEQAKQTAVHEDSVENIKQSMSQKETVMIYIKIGKCHDK